MASREEDEEDPSRCRGISHHGLDGILDHGYGKDNTKVMGPIQHLGSLKGMDYPAHYEVSIVILLLVGQREGD